MFLRQWALVMKKRRGSHPWTGCQSKTYFKCSEVDDTVDVRMVIEDLVDGSFIPYVNIVEKRSLATY